MHAMQYLQNKFTFYGNLYVEFFTWRKNKYRSQPRDLSLPCISFTFCLSGQPFNSIHLFPPIPACVDFSATMSRFGHSGFSTFCSQTPKHHSSPSVSFCWQCDPIAPSSHWRHEYLALVQSTSHRFLHILAAAPPNPWLTKPSLITGTAAGPLPHAREPGSHAHRCRSLALACRPGSFSPTSHPGRAVWKLPCLIIHLTDWRAPSCSGGAGGAGRRVGGNLLARLQQRWSHLHPCRGFPQI